MKAHVLFYGAIITLIVAVFVLLLVYGTPAASSIETPNHDDLFNRDNSTTMVLVSPGHPGEPVTRGV
jgi:hypothetical protein